MTKRLRLVVPAVLAAGGLLLTACEIGGATTSSGTTITSTAESTVVMSTSDIPSSTEDGALQPVDCGEVTLDSGAHQLIADAAANGIVGCTEAFDVVDEFVELPQEKKTEASLGNVILPSGWSCTVDDGATANLGCVKDDAGLSLHTEHQG